MTVSDKGTGEVWKANVGKEELLRMPSLYYVSSESMLNKSEMITEKYCEGCALPFRKGGGGGQTWLSNISSRK